MVGPDRRRLGEAENEDDEDSSAGAGGGGGEGVCEGGGGGGGEELMVGPSGEDGTGTMKGNRVVDMGIGGEGVGVGERGRAEENGKERKIRRTQHIKRCKYD